MDVLLGTKEAAARLKLSPRTLEKMRVTGTGPAFFKVGRLVAYTETTLGEWIADRRRKSTSDTGAGGMMAALCQKQNRAGARHEMGD